MTEDDIDHRLQASLSFVRDYLHRSGLRKSDYTIQKAAERIAKAIPHRGLEAEERSTLHKKKLAAFADRRKLFLDLRDEGKTYSEIAHEMGCTTARAREICDRALRQHRPDEWRAKRGIIS